MATSICRIFLLASLLSFARADERAHLRNEHERRWNTPPELTPESVVRIPSNGEPQARLLSLIPVTATISLNEGRNNAHSVSLGASLDGISLSESNNYDRPAAFWNDGPPVSVSKSATISAGLSGISSAGAKAFSNGGDAKTESHSLSLGQAAATSFGVVENGRAITGAASSVGAAQSSAVSGVGQGQSFAQASAVRYPNRPTWSNVGPSNGKYNCRLRIDDRGFGWPTLTVSKPHEDGRRPTLSVEAHDSWQQKPTLHIYKWQPDRKLSPRPSLSIERHDELRPHDSWSSRSHESPGLRVEVSSSPYGFSAGDSAPTINASPLAALAASSTGQAHTSGPQSLSFSRRNVGERSGASSAYDSGDSFAGEGHAGEATSGHRGGSSVARVNAQAAGNGRARGTASPEAGSFAKPVDDGGSARSPTVPSRHVGGRALVGQEQYDDIIEDLAQAVGELLGVA